MSETSKEKLLLDNGLKFFGRITASISHEINNIVTIVREVAGLLDDLIYMAEKGKPLQIEKLKSLSEKITLQTKRGKAIINYMNNFSHSIDEFTKKLDLIEVVDNTVKISRRFVHLKKRVLEFETPTMGVTVIGNPFLIRQSIFTCLDMILYSSASASEIIISISENEKEVKINIMSDSFEFSELAKEKGRYLEILMSEMNANLQTNINKNEEHIFSIVLPKNGNNKATGVIDG